MLHLFPENSLFANIATKGKVPDWINDELEPLTFVEIFMSEEMKKLLEENNGKSDHTSSQ